MKKLAPAALLGLLFLVSPSCSSVYEIQLESEPSPAKIFVNGEYVGETPQVVTMSFSEWDRVFLHLLRSDSVPFLDTYTESQLPDDELLVVRLQRDR